MLCNRRSLVLIGLLVLLIGAGCDGVHLCTTEIAPPSGTEPEELVRLVADSTGDFVLNHPLFTEVYDVVFEDNDSIPPALDIVQVEVFSDGEIHTIQIRTRTTDDQGGGVIEEMSRDDQRVSFGVYIDSDGNGVSDYLLTTTDSPERGVIVTPEFELVAEMPRLGFDDNVVSMEVPEEIVGARFEWLVFSGYSPTSEAFHTTALDNVFFVPQVDIVPSRAGMTGIITSYSGPGSCQVTDSRIITSTGKRSASCPANQGPFTTVPGTSQQGKMWYRKQCGKQGVEFWCVGSAFGVRVFDGSNQGWVGKCPYACGANWLNQWDYDENGLYDKIYHTIVDEDCYDISGNLIQKIDWDNDALRDIMIHDYRYSTNQVKSCNVEKNETTGSLLSPRCCPKRKPYANKSDVPGPGIDPTIANPTSPYNCPVSAP